jgi:trigger factor
MVEERMDFAMRNLSRQLQQYNMDPAQYLQMMGQTPESFRENSRASSERQVKIALALEKVAELENIIINDDDIEKEYEDAAKELNKDIEELKKSVERETLIEDLKLRAAVKLIIDSAVPEEESQEDKPAKKAKAKKKS